MGTPTAPAWAMPRSATVHSTRVLAMMETISPFFTPNATSPQAVSSPSCASWAQLTSCHAPATLRRAAVRCASCAARCWKSCATELTLASSLRCFCIAFRWLSAVAMVLLPAGLVVGHPLPCPVLQALVIGWIAAAALGVEDFLYQLAALVRARVADERIGEVDLRPPVARVRLDRLGEDPDRLVHVPLGPRQLVEVAPPDHLGRAVEKVPVDLQRGLEAVAELSFQPLGERGEDAHALRVEPHADTGVIVAAHVLRIGEDGLVAGFPSAAFSSPSVPSASQLRSEARRQLASNERGSTESCSRTMPSSCFSTPGSSRFCHKSSKRSLHPAGPSAGARPGCVATGGPASAGLTVGAWATAAEEKNRARAETRMGAKGYHRGERLGNVKASRGRQVSAWSNTARPRRRRAAA